MARVTVEDCVLVVENRFELVVLASQRAKDIASGAHPTIERDNDKNPVIALREIADRTVDVPVLRNNLIISMQKRTKFDRMEESEEDMDEVSQDILESLALDAPPVLSLIDDSDLSFDDDIDFED
jgi:DNA-directed RNA polymerase subunit omega